MRATQYLPDIVKLHHHLYKTYHHRINVKVAHEVTIGNFLKKSMYAEDKHYMRNMYEIVQ